MAKGKHSKKTSKETKDVKEAKASVDQGFSVSSVSDGWSTSTAVEVKSPLDEVKASTESAMKKKQRRRKAKRIAIIVACSIVALGVAAYIAGCVYFATHFFPDTIMGSVDVSGKDAKQVAQELDDASRDYVMTVEGEGGLQFRFTMEDATMTMDSLTVAQEGLGIVPCWQWPVQISKTHDVSEAVTASYDEEAMTAVVTAAVKTHNKTAKNPVDATIGYDKETNGFAVIKEKPGTKYDVDAVLKEVGQAACCMKDSLTLSEEALVKADVLSDDPRLAQAAEKAQEFLGADLKLKLGKKEVARIDAELICSWVTVGKDYNPTLSQKKLKKWVNDLASQCDTVGSKRSFKLPNGKKTYTVEGGDYGWKIAHKKLIKKVQSSVAKGETGTLDIPCTSTAKAYNGQGKADWGKRFMDINLTKQRARLYDNGKIIWSSDIVSGSPDGVHDTPTGVYDINLKASPQKLIGYENGKKIYESKVTYWMPFDGNAIGLHDADWQAAFGGQLYKQGRGSHGCVNLPVYKAAELYGIIRIGDVIVVHF